MMKKIKDTLLNLALMAYEKILASIPQKKEKDIRIHETPRCRAKGLPEDQKETPKQ